MAGKPTAKPAPVDEDEALLPEPDEEEAEDTPTVEPKVLRAEWLESLESRINERLTGLEQRVIDRLQALTPKPPDPPKVEPEVSETSSPKLPEKDTPPLTPEPEPIRGLFGFLTKAPPRR